MFKSIHWRISIPFILLILLLMLVLGVYLSRSIRQIEINSLQNELASETHLLADTLSTSGGNPFSTSVAGQLATRWADILDARVTLIRSDGTVVGESHEDLTGMDNHLNRPEIQQAKVEGVGRSIRYSQTVGTDMIYVAARVERSGQLAGFVRVSVPLREIQANITNIQHTILAGTLIAAVLAVLLAALIARYTTRPLRSLTAEIQQMSVRGLQTAGIASSAQDEIGQLTRAFNIMGSELRSRFADLEAERSKLSSVLDQMTDGVMIIDRGGQVELINRAALRIFGISEPEAMSNSFAWIVHHYQIVDLWETSKKTGEVQQISLELPVRRLFLQVTATPFRGPLPDHTLILIQDLTRMRRLETMRSDFISNISHELRTPLASLKALTDTLLEGALEDPPAARHFLNRIETELDALTLIVQELLELSRIESGKVPLQLNPVAPCSLILSAVERLKLQADRAGLLIEIQCPENLPPVLADSTRIEQVIVNLLHNAIKFTPSGGKITISARVADGSVQFSVADNGVGIPAEDLPRIFERFYKADRARSGGGTGLGLAISRHLVAAHNGDIWAESVESKGSTFYFTLPVTD